MAPIVVLSQETNKPEPKPTETKATNIAAPNRAESKEVGVMEETNPEPHLKYKEWVLKVSVHCEACKRKVKKILQRIDGVYESEIDLKLQKLTVKGKVDSDTLINKLTKKTGKHVELWPEPHKAKKKGKSKTKEKLISEDPESGEEDKDKDTLKTDQAQDPSSHNPNVATCSNKPSETGKSGNQSAVLVVGDGEEAETGVAVSNNGGGSGGKKKKKKGHKGNANVTIVDNTCADVEHPNCDQANAQLGTGSPGHPNVINGHGQVQLGTGSPGHANVITGHGQVPLGAGSPGHGNVITGHGQVPLGTGSPGQGQSPVPYPANYSPPRYYVEHYPATMHGSPRYHVEHYPATMHGPPRYHVEHYPSTVQYYTPSVQAVNCNTTYPSSSSYVTSYYNRSPTHSYVCMHPSTGSEHSQSDLDSRTSQPSDSFDFLSDENPNACNVM